VDVRVDYTLQEVLSRMSASPWRHASLRERVANQREHRRNALFR